MDKLTFKSNKAAFGMVFVLITFAVLSRLAPHPANVAPMAAVALFAGALLPRRWAMTVPLAAMVVSDMFIGMHSLVAFTWGSFALIALLSSYRFKSITFGGVASGSIGASVLFYVVTNFGVWAEGRLYNRTFSGLLQCYYNALPFFRNTLLGDMVYAGLLFGTYALVVRTSTTGQHARDAIGA